MKNPNYLKYREDRKRVLDANKRAKHLAKQILKKDWNKLEKHYLLFKVKIKTKGRRLVKNVYLFKDGSLYYYDKITCYYYKYCSILYDANKQEGAIYSVYDKIIAYYLWLKHYEKIGLDYLSFIRQFNPITHATYTKKEMFKNSRTGRF